MTNKSPVSMSDSELLAATSRVAGDERRATAELLALLAEIDTRRLYLGEGCSSLFTYCTQVLRLSEHAAYHRIETARAARSFPVILELVADGSITTTTVALLRPHLTIENHAALIGAARHKSKREVEYQIACLAPRPDAKALIRSLPARAPAGSVPGERCSAVKSDDEVALPLLAAPPPAPETLSPRPQVTPLARDRYLLRVTLNGEAEAKLRRAQELMGHRVPNGDPAVIIAEALSILVTQLERTKIASVRRPRVRAAQQSPSASGSRHVPASMRRRVWARDQGRCAFVGSRGRCAETRRLEFHHITPFARGGPTNVENLALRCRAHNGYESDMAFGARTTVPVSVAAGTPA
jgi:5-methylcytosine-specific restriction endonuclease McrA